MNTLFCEDFSVNEPSDNYQRHVNNLRYLEWFIDLAIKHAQTLGWGIQACRELNLAWVAKSHSIEYFSPAYQGDDLTLCTWIEKVTPTRVTRCYECKRGEKLLCKAHTVWVLVDYDTERPKAMPKMLTEKFTQALYPS